MSRVVSASRDLRGVTHTIGVVGSVREEVAAGQFSQQFIDACRIVARAVSQTRPSPSDQGTWLMDEIDELVHDTVVRVGTEKLALAANAALNDAQFIGGWMREALRTTLDLRARQTPSGRVIRAMDDALREDPDRFYLENGYWRLAADNRQPGWRGGQAPLLEAAWEVETTTVRMSQGALKTPPIAARRDIRAVCATVLQQSGPLAKVDLAEVLAQRFNVIFEARFDYLDLDGETHVRSVETASEDAFDAVDDELAARSMLEQLTGPERRVLELVLGGKSLRDLAHELDCTKYRAGIIYDRLVEKLRLLANSSPYDSQVVTERLLELARQHDELRHSTESDGGEYGD